MASRPTLPHLPLWLQPEPHPPGGTDGSWRMLSARAPPGVRRWKGGRGQSELGCVQRSLGWGKDSAPGRRCAVQARPPARVRSGPGGGPPRWGGGPWRRSAVGGSRFPPARKDVRENRGAESAGERRSRGNEGAGVRGVPGTAQHGRSVLGPYAERRPLARGRRTEAGSESEPAGVPVVPRAARHVGTRGAAPPGAGAERRARGPGSYLPGSRG